MRNILALGLTAIVLVSVAGESQAQYLTTRSFWAAPAPYYYGPPLSATAGYVSPYGYQSSYSAGVSLGFVPGYYNSYLGPVAYYSYGASARPYVSGPFHSIYWNPYSSTYGYTAGYRNMSNYYYSYPGYP